MNLIKSFYAFDLKLYVKLLLAVNAENTHQTFKIKF